MQTPRKLPSPLRLGSVSPKVSVTLDDSPVMSKRRRTDLVTSSPPVQDTSQVTEGDGSLSLSITPLSTPSDSPVPPPWVGLAAAAAEGGGPAEVEDGSVTPRRATSSSHQYKRRHDLWRAIASNYQYLMDDELIEACKSAESDDLSWESDDLDTNSRVSFAEFVQQCKELADWLAQLRITVGRPTSVLSEKYLHQNQEDELRQYAPRRRMLGDYGRQLMRRYPSLRDDIAVRLQRLNTEWDTAEKTLTALNFGDNCATIRQDIDMDLANLTQWLDRVECSLQLSWLQSHWSADDVRVKLGEIQTLHADIQARSKDIGAVQQLCELVNTASRVQGGGGVKVGGDCDRQLAGVAALRRQWHRAWLQSVEWQCRLEEALEDRLAGKVRSRRALKLDDDADADDVLASPLPPLSSGDVTGCDYSGACDQTEFVESDDCSSEDIIPFHENEYERLATVPTIPPTGVAVEEVDAGVPVTDASGGTMRGDVAKDVGYSTESLSNEDGGGNGCVGSGTATASYHKPRSSSFESSSLPALSSEADCGSAMKQKQGWRQSAASCYDTGSNGSLSKASVKGNDGAPPVTLTYVSAPVPHRHYYCVTNVDRELQDDADLIEEAANTRGQVVSESDVSASFGAPHPAAASAAADASISGALDGGDNDTSFGASSLSESDGENDEMNGLDSSEATGFKQNAGKLSRPHGSQLSAFSDIQPTTPRNINKTSSTLEQSPITPLSAIRSRTLGRGSSSESDEFVTALSEWEESTYSDFGSPVKPRSRKRLDYLASSDNTLNKVALKQSLVSAQTVPSLNVSRDSPVLKNSTNTRKLAKKSAVKDYSNSPFAAKTGSGSMLHSTPRGKENGVSDSAGGSSTKRSGRKRALLSNNKKYKDNVTDDKVTDSDAEVIEIMRHADVSMAGEGVYLLESQLEAWDNYQDPMYPSVSDDSNEEMLDASHLQGDWEAGLDDTGKRRAVAGGQKRGKPRRRSKAKDVAMGNGGDVSDSDQEDFNDVVERSEEAIRFFETFLTKKQHKKKQSAGLLDPSEYAEAVQTCEYYIQCLRDVYNTLVSEMEVSGVKPVGMQQITACIGRLDALCKVAQQRHSQARELAAMSSGQTQLKTSLQSMVVTLDVLASDGHQLASLLRSLQDKRQLADKLAARLEELNTQLVTFTDANTDVCTKPAMDNITELKQSLLCFRERCVTREAEIEAAQLTYSRWEGEERELDQRLTQEEQHVHCLTVAVDTVAFSPTDCQEAVNDMQALAADASMYNSRLDSCRQYLADLAPVLDSAALQCMAERLARLSHRVASLHRQADIMAERLKQPRTASVGIQADLLTSLDTPRYEGYTTSGSGMDMMEGDSAPRVWTVLRRVLPVGLATIVLVSLMSAFGVSWQDTLRCLGLNFNLDLRHINGPRSS